MQHRHIDIPRSGALSLAAIDDIIERGGIDDWIELGRLARSAPEQRDKILRLARRTIATSERPDRPSFWITFCERASTFGNPVER